MTSPTLAPVPHPGIPQTPQAGCSPPHLDIFPLVVEPPSPKTSAHFCVSLADKPPENGKKSCVRGRQSGVNPPSGGIRRIRICCTFAGALPAQCFTLCCSTERNGEVANNGTKRKYATSVMDSSTKLADHTSDTQDVFT